MNFTDVRAEVNVTAGGMLIPNTSLTVKKPTTWQTGDYVVYNDTGTREIHVVFNGRNKSKANVKMIGARCKGPCISAVNTNVTTESTIRRWSNPLNWDTGKIPVAGDNVTILPGWNMLFDSADSQVLNYL